MSLLFIIRIIFVLGHGPLKSFGRKLVITAAIFVTALPKWDLHDERIIYIWIVCFWALIHLFFYYPTFPMEILRQEVREDISFDHDYTWNSLDRDFTVNSKFIRIITIPFNLKFLWNAVNQSSFFQKYFRLSLNGTMKIQQSTPNTEIAESTRSLRLWKWLRRRLEVLKYCLSIALLLILYFVIGFPLLFMLVLVKLISAPLLLSLSSNNCTNKRCKLMVHFLTKAIAFILIMFFYIQVLGFYVFFLHWPVP